jgi:serine/threonine protein kinase
MSGTQEQSNPESVAGEAYGPSANFESIVDKFKTWKSNTDSLQLKIEYDQLLKGLWWPAGTTVKSDADSDFTERPPVIIERKFLSYHWLCSVKQIIGLEIEPVVWNDGTVGVAALETLLHELDVSIISSSFQDITEVKHIASGASFDVTLARALKDSDIPADRTGCSRPQWRKQDWLALKQGLFPMAQQQHTGTNNDWQTYRAILQEVRILNHPEIRRHPNFVRLFGVIWHGHTGHEGESVVTPVLVQDYATHGDLQGFLRAKSAEDILTRQLKIQLITGVSEGLQALHALGVIHGDVKCENILVSWDATRKTFVPKISDFGFSIIENSTGLSKYVDISIKVLGVTKRYLAPELWTPAETDSVSLTTRLAVRTDIYSFGLVILTISLDGEDIFDAFTKLHAERGLIRVGEGTEWAEIVDAVTSRSKTNARMGELFLESLTSRISKRDADFAGQVYPIVSKMLTQDPEERLADLRIVKSHFSHTEGPEMVSDLSLEGLSVSAPSAA